jgi:hypothetical protein
LITTKENDLRNWFRIYLVLGTLLISLLPLIPDWYEFDEVLGTSHPLLNQLNELEHSLFQGDFLWSDYELWGFLGLELLLIVLLFNFNSFSRISFVIFEIYTFPNEISGMYFPIAISVFDGLLAYIGGAYAAGMIFFIYFSPLKEEFRKSTPFFKWLSSVFIKLPEDKN